jgi:hypothetical protein
MKLSYDPFPLIFARGDETTKLACLEFFGLKSSPQAEAYRSQSVRQQRHDGSLPSRLDPRNWGMLETTRSALLLLKAGLLSEDVTISRAVRSILQHQNPDGGWSENPALKIPPEQTWLSSERSITWLSADIIDLLKQVGMNACSERQRAVEWLRAMQTDAGGWPSLAPEEDAKKEPGYDPDATVQIGFLMGDLYGKTDSAFLKTKALLERHLDECVQDVESGYRIRLRDGKPEPIEVYHLTHLLLSSLVDPPRRLKSGYDVSDPRVRRMMKALLDIQQRDGGWCPFWAKESDPVYTLLAMKVLIYTKALEKGPCKDRVKVFAG